MDGRSRRVNGSQKRQTDGWQVQTDEQPSEEADYGWQVQTDEQESVEAD